MTTNPTAPSCPTPHTLVRFSEGRLLQEEAAQVLRHLDSCENCMEAVDLANDILTAERTGVVRRIPRWPIAAAAAALLAFAALLFVQRRPDSPEGIAQIVALAPREERLVESRLSGGFPWAGYRGPQRAGATPDPARMKLIGAAGQAAERAQREEGSAEAQHVAGVAMLMAGQPLEGVRALENAAARAPQEARIRSDLAAARYAAALVLGRPSLYPEALADADAALRIDPGLAEALFNRALILERLALRDQARAAWQRYLEVDSSSPWATEARAHLQALPPADRDSRFRRDLEQLERAAVAGDAPRVREIVQAHPQQCRASAEGDQLGRWGQAMLRGDDAEARRLLTIARAIGEALERVNGETLLRDAVAAIDASSARTALATAHAAYREGRVLYARQQPSAAEKHLRDAARQFEQAGSPMARVARYFAANTAFDRQMIPAARRELAALAAEIPAGHDALAAQVRWELALCAMFDGNWPEALSLLRESESLFLRGGESGNAANVQSLLATTLTMMGRTDEAWTARIAAFDALQDNRERLLVAIGGAARMELRGTRRLPSALALMQIEESLCREQNSAAYTAETLVRQALLSEELGEHAAADRLVAAAGSTAARVEDPNLRGRLEADVRLARGAVLLRSDPRTARAELSHAVDAYRAREYTFLLPEAYLLRGRAAWRDGDPASAASDLDRGIEAFERHPVRHAEAVVGTGVLDAGRALFEDAIRLHLERRNEAAAFAYAERARTRLTADAPAGVAQLQERLAGSGAVVLAVIALPDELVAFCVTPGVLRAARSPIDRVRLEKLATQSDAAAMHELYDLVIRPFADELRAARTLIFVPDRVLQSVAFAALADRRTSERLVERFAVVTTPRASALRGDRASSAPRALLAVALPSGETAGSAALPDGEREVREIGGSYGTARLLVSSGATFAAFRDAAPHADVIHIAGHTEHQTTAGTSFVFAGGEHAGWRAIAALPVARGSVVVLAGCETLRTVAPLHEHAQTLGEAFLAAGSRAVVGTLAPIADREAHDFFARFHRQLASGAGEAEALRRTQVESMSRGQAWQSITLLTTRIPAS